MDSVATEEVSLDRLERLLGKQRKPVTGKGRDYLVFNDPWWQNPFGPSWPAMVIYDKGHFWIERGVEGRRLRYDLRSLHGLIFCLVGALMFFAFGIAGGGFLLGLRLACLAFAWLYGMNILLALMRVPRLIRKAVRET